MAAALRSLGCAPTGDIVALAFGREIESVVGMLGALRAGCALMPLDIENTPAERVAAMLEDAQPKVFLFMDRSGF